MVIVCFLLSGIDKNRSFQYILNILVVFPPGEGLKQQNIGAEMNTIWPLFFSYTCLAFNNHGFETEFSDQAT